MCTRSLTIALLPLLRKKWTNYFQNGRWLAKPLAHITQKLQGDVELAGTLVSLRSLFQVRISERNVEPVIVRLR
jgi:hypothetical protein